MKEVAGCLLAHWLEKTSSNIDSPAERNNLKAFSLFVCVCLSVCVRRRRRVAKANEERKKKDTRRPGAAIEQTSTELMMHRLSISIATRLYRLTAGPARPVPSHPAPRWGAVFRPPPSLMMVLLDSDLVSPCCIIYFFLFHDDDDGIVLPIIPFFSRNQQPSKHSL